MFFNINGQNPLAQTDLGDSSSVVQQVSYGYTLQGWLKWANGTAVPVPGGAPLPAISDAYGYGLNYYGGGRGSAPDYAPADGSVYVPFSNPLFRISTFSPLYNGNIAGMSVNIPQLGSSSYNFYTFRYDQLNRLKAKQVYLAYEGTPVMNPTAAWQENFNYDGNGNILRVLRNDNSGNAMDSLNYHYNTDSTGRLINNQLNYIADQC